jgi:hypothetical protein
MEIDYKDGAAVRARYIGLNISSRAFARKLSDITGSSTFPGEVITFTELGMSWVDRSILREYDRPRIFSHDAANLENGGLLPEVENFCKATDLLKLGRWQSVLYRSGLYENTYRPYRSSASTFGLNEEWFNSEEQLICIDQDFLVAAYAAVTVLIFGSQRHPHGALLGFLNSIAELPIRETKLPLHSFRKRLKKSLGILSQKNIEIDPIFSLTEGEFDVLNTL